MCFYFDDIKFNMLFWILCAIILILLVFPYLRFKKEKVNLPMWVYFVWLFAVISLALSLLCFFVFVFPNTKWDVNAVSVAIILAFVGILATFVVVNNHIQLKQTEDKIDDKYKEIETLLSDIDDSKKRLVKLEDIFLNPRATALYLQGQRQFKGAMDITSVQPSKDAAKDYVTKNYTAYEGQIISYLDGEKYEIGIISGKKLMKIEGIKYVEV